MPARFETHEVTNQSPPFEDVNLFTTDVALREAVSREGGDAGQTDLAAFGSICGSARAIALARKANRYTPELETFDAKGNRRDVVEFHPAYHELMSISFAEGLHCRTWEHLAEQGRAPEPGANVIRAAGCYMEAQMEPGHCCPITMTHAAVPTLMLEPSLAKTWLPLILSRRYDPSFRPASEKMSVTIGPMLK